ncbi:hypothetical protein F5I97DRAFT_1830966 [Phlebopus sp. FC_14]|nr:hypothetical protein F5I97DRAFT_1830966 [Phlebopus sp. FC_14]
MGPSRKDQRLTQDEVTVLLREKDDQIANLEARLEAYSARASTAHARLLKTIDVLDALRTRHALELSSEEQAKLKLAHEVDRWRSIAQTLEVERDELKDVVEELIEKVQISNEWSSWPCSRMHIAKHAEVVAESSIERGLGRETSKDDLPAYAASIISRLRAEIDFERQGHFKTVEEANLRIEELEAKVTVREAELEACVNSPSHLSEHNVTAIRTSGTRMPARKISRPKPISDEECLRFLESNNTRNRSLEAEIRSIAQRLEDAKASTSKPGVAELNTHGFHSTEQLSPRIGYEAPISEKPGTALPGDVVTTPAPAVHGHTEPAGGPQDPGSPLIILSIAQLDNQIRSMSAQTEFLKAERVALIEAVARQKRASLGMRMDDFQTVLRVEEECVRLSVQVSELQQELEDVRNSAKFRETELLQEIERLKSSTRRPSSHFLRVHNTHPLEEDINDHESMELATPLQPTTILTAQSPANPFGFTEPLLVPLPFSPERASSPAALTPPASRSPDQYDMQQKSSDGEREFTNSAKS